MLRLTPTHFGLLAVTFIVAVCTNSLAIAEEEANWYAAVGGGVSMLNPKMGSSGLTIDQKTDTALTVSLGLDVNPRFSLEMSLNELGQATLSNQGFVSYSSLGASAVWHWWGNPQAIASRSGLWSYGRLGVNRIDNSGSSVDLSSSDSTAMQLGAGLEWSFAPQLSLRAEFASVDSDAQFGTVAVVWRSRAPTKSSDQTSTAELTTNPAAVIAEPAQPVADERVESVELEDSNRQIPVPVQSPKASLPAPAEVKPVAPERPNPELGSNPRINPAIENCAVPAPAEPLDENGCALFSGITAITFAPGTANLTRAGEKTIGELAIKMLQYNAVNLQIEAHATLPSGGSAAAAQLLSRERAFAVAAALVKSGVSVDRLQARAFGQSRPRVDSGTTVSERLNNRIELKVTP